ncbi:GlcNAc-binding protein A [Anthophora retusa]
MLLLTSLFTATILNNLIGYNDCKLFPSNIGNLENVDLRTTAVLTEPSSRAYNCFLETNYNCNVFKSNENSGTIIGPLDFLENEVNNGKIASAANPSYSILDEHSPGRWNPSHLRIKVHNSTHLITRIAWTLNNGNVTIDSVKVFLSNGNYTEEQLIQRSSLNLACSYEHDSKINIVNNVLRFDCYIPREFVEDLLYGAKGSGVLVSTLRLAGETYAFYQVADISLNEPIKQIANFHGYISDPPSRAKLCQLRVNKNCGFITYEPQSVEGFKGFPEEDYSPPDGKIASANNPRFQQLDEYGSNRWVRVKFPDVKCLNKTHVSFDLSWYFTAVHLSENIRVYVSNENYTPNEPLSRRHLDLNVLCIMELHGKFPPYQLTIPCPISLEKYRKLSERKELLLLSIWDVYDTAFGFYQVIDLQGLSGEQSYENVSRKCQ